MRVVRATLLIAAVAILFPPAASASTATGSLSVTATVSDSCAITSGGGTLSFGAYDPVIANATTPATQSTTFQLTCTNGTSATILLGQGSNPSSGSTDAVPVRNMVYSGTKLNYQLYTTSARTTVWNNTTGVGQSANGLAQPITVYGSIPAGQTVGSGSYADTVVITISFN
jgi:spore coat protein U-like protein